MSSYVVKVLLPDERIIYAATLHWMIYLQGLFITAFGGIMAYGSYPVLALMFGERIGTEFMKPVGTIAMVVVLVGIALLLGAYIRQTSTEIVITNKRLIAKYGFISRTTFEILANRITGANFDQSVAGRVLGFGTILVHGAGGEISPIDQVDNPQLFYRALVSVLEKHQH
jgi:uncharacterized membrane protein YdbT with pleckstrin-like domain